MKAGEHARLYCNGCHTEFELTLEPNAVRLEAMPRKVVGNCPFCGSGFIRSKFQIEQGELTR